MSTTLVNQPRYDTWVNYSKKSPCTFYERWSVNGNVGNYQSLSNDEESRPYPTSLLTAMTGQTKQHRFDFHKTWEEGVRRRTATCDGQSVDQFETWLLARDFDQGRCVEPAPDATDWQTCIRLRLKDRFVNLGASVAEYRDTCDMFKNAARGTYNAWKALKGKKKWRDFKPRDVAASNVVLSYGVLPLYNDLYDSYSALTERLGLPVWQRVTCQRKIQESGSAEAPAGYQGKDEWSWTFSERAVIYAKLKHDEPRFTMGNPVELAWELIPFSFVVDWLIPIGDALSALDALHGVEQTTGTVTRKFKGATISTIIRDNAYGINRSCKAAGTYVVETHERSVVSTIPLPNMPTYRPSTSFRAVANGISLLVLLKS